MWNREGEISPPSCLVQVYCTLLKMIKIVSHLPAVVKVVTKVPFLSLPPTLHVTVSKMHQSHGDMRGFRRNPKIGKPKTQLRVCITFK